MPKTNDDHLGYRERPKFCHNPENKPVDCFDGQTYFQKIECDLCECMYINFHSNV